MSSTTPIPAGTTLTEAKVRNPHRRLSDKHDKRSLLEQSFWKNDTTEIQYWLDCGVVKEAMEGKAKSKINYRASLMDCFVNGLDNRYRTSLSESEEKIFLRLWEMGANEETKYHHSWLVYLIASPARELLLNAGADPWAIKDPSIQTKTRLKIYGNGHEPQNGLEAAMRILAARQANIEKSGETPKLIEERADLQRLVEQFMRMENTDPQALQRALGFVIRGAASVYEKQHQQVWARWRDQLLGMGAEVSVFHTNGFQQLISTAPTSPVSTYEPGDFVRNEIARRKKLAEEAGERFDFQWEQKLAQEIRQEYIARRALGWIKLANSWLDVFEPHLLRPLSKEEYERSSRQSAAQEKMDLLSGPLDAPGGEQVALRLARIMTRAGHPMPWQKTDNDSQRLDLSKSIQMDGKRSLRKLLAWQEMLKDPVVLSKGVDKKFKSLLASEYVALERPTDRSEDVPPGGRFERKEEFRRSLFTLRQGISREAAPVIKEEMEILLDLSTPGSHKEMFDYVGTWYGAKRHWAGQLFSDLGKMGGGEWLKKDLLKERKITLDLMGENGFLQHALEIYAGLDDIAALDESGRDNLSRKLWSNTLHWRLDWIGKPDREKELMGLIRKNAPELEGRLSKLITYHRFESMKPCQDDEVELDPVLESLLVDDPLLRDLLGKIASKNLEKTGADVVSDTFSSNLNRFYQALLLGYIPEDRQKITNNLIWLSTAGADISETSQMLMGKVFAKLGQGVQQTLGVMAQYQVDNHPQSERWVPIVVLAIESGAEISVPEEFKGRNSGAAAYAEAALKKRELGKVAERTTQSSGVEVQSSGNNRPKM